MEKRNFVFRLEGVGNTDVYVFDVETANGYSSLGDNVSRIHYSKEMGIIRLFFKTHWGTELIKQ
jgi:hypothetical protein